MADEPENDAKRLILFLILGVPTVGRIIAVALLVGATGVAFFDIGDYASDGERANAAFVLALLALIALGLSFAIPSLLTRLLKRK